MHLSGNAVHYGPFRAAPLGVTQGFAPRTTLDIAAGFDIAGESRFDVGVLDATDAFPDRVIGATDGCVYTEGGGLNFNGHE